MRRRTPFASRIWQRIDLNDVIEQAAGSAEWGDDNTSITRPEDDAKRADKLWRHTLGAQQTDDTLDHPRAGRPLPRLSAQNA